MKKGRKVIKGSTSFRSRASNKVCENSENHDNPVLFLDVVGKYFNERFIRTGNMAMSAAIKETGAKTCLLTIYEEEDPESAVKKIRSLQPQLIMISIFSILLHASSKVLKVLRSKLDIPVIAGGHHPTADPGSVLALEGIDMVCVGEGDLIIPRLLELVYKAKDRKELLASLKSYSLPGIWYRNEEGIVVDRGAAPISHNLDELMPWDRELYPRPFIEDNSLLKMGRIVPVYSGRGCPFSCSYCANTKLQSMYGKDNLVRKRTPLSVVKELANLRHRWDADSFFFCDEQFLLSPSWTQEFTKLYKSEVNIPYVIMAAPQSIDDNVSRLLFSSGCRFVNMGLESGNEKFRRTLLSKRFSNNGFLKAVRSLQNSGIKVCVNIMIRLPEESVENARSTLDILARAKPDQIEVCTYNPFPGTRLARYAHENGLLEEIEGAELREEFKHQQSIKEFQLFRIDEDRFIRTRLSQMTKEEYRWYSDAVEAMFWNIDMRFVSFFSIGGKSTSRNLGRNNIKLLATGRHGDLETELQKKDSITWRRFLPVPEGKAVSSNPNVLSIFLNELDAQKPSAVFFENPEDGAALLDQVTDRNCCVFAPPETHKWLYNSSNSALSKIGAIDPDLFTPELLTWITHTKEDLVKAERAERTNNLKIPLSKTHSMEKENKREEEEFPQKGKQPKIYDKSKAQESEHFWDIEISSTGDSEASHFTAAMITAHIFNSLHDNPKNGVFSFSHQSGGAAIMTAKGLSYTLRLVVKPEQNRPRLFAKAKRYPKSIIRDNVDAAHHASLCAHGAETEETVWSRGPHHETLLIKSVTKITGTQNAGSQKSETKSARTHIKRMRRQGVKPHEMMARAIMSFLHAGSVGFMNGHDLILADQMITELSESAKPLPTPLSQKKIWSSPDHENNISNPLPSDMVARLKPNEIFDMDPPTGRDVVFVESFGENNKNPGLLNGQTGEFAELPSHPTFKEWEDSGGPFYKAFAACEGKENSKNTDGGSEKTDDVLERRPVWSDRVRMRSDGPSARRDEGEYRAIFDRETTQMTASAGPGVRREIKPVAVLEAYLSAWNKIKRGSMK